MVAKELVYNRFSIRYGTKELSLKALISNANIELTLRNHPRLNFKINKITTDANLTQIICFKIILLVIIFTIMTSSPRLLNGLFIKQSFLNEEKQKERIMRELNDRAK